MALAVAKAARLKPNIRLAQVLKEYEASLTGEQKDEYLQTGPPSANAVITLTCDIDRRNEKRKTRRYGARLTTFLNSVKGFTAIVDVVVGSVGNPIAGAVWGAVKIAMQAAAGFETYFSSLSTLVMNVGLNSPRFDKYALLYPDSSSLQEELCDYYTVVIKLCTAIVTFVQQPTKKLIASALRKPFDERFGPLQKDLNRLAIAVKEEVTLATAQQQKLEATEAARDRKESSLFRATASSFRKETANELAQARTWRLENTKLRLLKSCSRYNQETSFNQARKKGVSTWIFDKPAYKDWRSNDSAVTLVCSGIVGSGKTVLSASVVEQLVSTSSEEGSLSYFFCNSNDAASLKVREILGSLARQWLENLPNDTYSAIKRESGLGFIALDADRIVGYLLELLPKGREYIIVLDGVDECEREDITTLLDLIQSLQNAPGRIFKLFLTARSDIAVRISEQIQAGWQVAVSLSNGPEISRFIHLALEDALQSKRLKLGDANIILNIHDALEEGADGMFLWVVFQIESICAQNTDHDILESLKDLPRGLPATFRRILGRLRRSDAINMKLARSIFSVVAAAQRPLMLEEVREAISIVPGDTHWDNSRLVNDIEKSLESCGSLIVVDEEQFTVQFAHSSVRSHLLSDPMDVDDVREYHITLEQANFDMGNIVITYLNLGVFETQISKVGYATHTSKTHIPSAVIKSTLLGNDIVSKKALTLLQSRVKPSTNTRRNSQQVAAGSGETQQNFRFLPYCQEFWFYHSQLVQDVGNKQIYRFWERLVAGIVKTVELPWAPERQDDIGERFMQWLRDQRHVALVLYAIRQLWDYPPETVSTELSHVTQKTMAFRIRRLQTLIDFLPIDLEQYRLLLTPKHDYDGWLQFATLQGYEGVVRLIVSQHPKAVNAWVDRNGIALHAAVCCGYVEIAKILLHSGADVNVRGAEYHKALHKAQELTSNEASTLQKKQIDQLMKEGGKLKLRPQTPLWLAARLWNEEIVDLLLDYNPTIEGTTLQAITVHYKTSPEIAGKIAFWSVAAKAAKGPLSGVR